MDLLAGLNEAQIEAVKTESGPLLILAGAGSGKTKTLTHRIAYLIANHKIQPNQILAVTFTNKAAKEMRSRLARLLNQKSENRFFMPWMGTFHGICVRLLRIDGQELGIDSNFVIYDEDDRLGLVKRIIKTDQNLDDKIKAKTVVSHISSAKNSMINPDDFLLTASSPFIKDVANIYKQYEVMRRKAGALDFDDLLLEAVKLLNTKPDIRQKWRNHFKHILVDEYQDTNPAQYQIIKLLVNDENNICVVGDDWQSIYSWRGADYTNILNFEKDFKAKVIKLEQNYRSTANILDAANQVIVNNKKRTDKKLWTDMGQGEPVRLFEVSDENAEANIVAQTINDLIGSKKFNYGDFAILYRTNAQSYTLERVFIFNSIPYQIIGGVRFYDRKEIKDIIAYLRLIYQPNDIVSFSRIVNIPARGIGPTSLNRFLNWQVAQNQNIIESLGLVEHIVGLQPKAKQALLKLGKMLEKLQAMVGSHTPKDIIDALLKMTNYRDYLADGTLQAEERDANIGSLLSDSQAFNDLASFLEEVALMSSTDQDSDSQKVTLMTLHAAKGLEFPVVFIVGLEEGLLPHSKVFIGKDDDLEEERRLCYVGMTRARQYLYLSYAFNRMQFGQSSFSSVSRFVDEMGDTIERKSSIVEFNQDYRFSKFNDSQTQDFFSDILFDVGDRVKSTSFGVGEIIEVDGLAVTVKFESGSTKKLNIEYARLEKV